ncbi:cytochrome ubiquinol oxidase subunit I [Cellulomonas chitinilytica]|uniref:Cytochrome ubiquinol oxidase subunit I n=1 Tax=Cellulomonas chitinilytica TaxID=398759 RepID=A0A919U0R7_9CELL|nr:cytochrome ubiquinol oxidase subunit I [Cellulomonas chitinilytica]GIG19419.1 cytochrome ubiquinol oxidase subunit I [Cellulomonas chitinilytica]
MSALDLARLQFASTSIYHFLFVPITIGLAFLVAVLHTLWFRSGHADHRRLTRFFGTLLLINVAVGVVTGLVQEFQFGMNWSAYSRFVGDVFGAPLAMEGLAAFFLESTFIGLWVFGWRVLPPRVHLLSAWLVALGAAGSAAFIMAANSWMQHPVGYTVDPSTGRPRLSDIGAVMTNPVFLWGYLHVLLAAAVTGTTVMLAVSAWYLRRGRDVELFTRSAKLSLAVLLPAILLTLGVGSHLGVIEATYQPMKISAAEAQWTDCGPCSFSAFQVGGGNDDQDPTKIIEIPHLLSLLATGTWNGSVQGLNELNAQYQEEFGPGSYVPNVFVQYWSMRVMAYLGSLAALLALWGVWVWWRGRLPTARVFLWVATWAAVAPLVMNTAGWMLTENGRQPWIVQGLMRTADGVSPSVSTTEIVLSLVVFYGVFLLLGAVNVFLMLRFARRGLELEPDEPEHAGDDGQPRVPVLTF